MAKAMFIMDKPESCLRCPRRFVIYDGTGGYQHCAFDTDGYKLETFFKAEDLKDGFISSYCPLREVPQKKSMRMLDDASQFYRQGYNTCIDEIGGGE